MNLIEPIQKVVSERDQVELDHRAKVEELASLKEGSNAESDLEQRISLTEV